VGIEDRLDIPQAVPGEDSDLRQRRLGKRQANGRVPSRLELAARAKVLAKSPDPSRERLGLLADVINVFICRAAALSPLPIQKLGQLLIGGQCQHH